MSTAILWHRACEILHIPGDERAKGWPDSLNIEQIARLHSPDDKAMAPALLSLMKTAVANGELHSNGTGHVITGAVYKGAGEFDRILVPFMEQRPSPNQVETWGHDVPTVTADSYENWSDRPPIPEDSPLRDWITERGSGSQQRGEGKIVRYKKPDRSNAWLEVLIACIEEFENDHQYTPNTTQLQRRLIEKPPRGFGVAWNKEKKHFEMIGEAPMDDRSLEGRHRRLYAQRHDK